LAQVKRVLSRLVPTSFIDALDFFRFALDGETFNHMGAAWRPIVVASAGCKTTK
jgi:hypothetical protein